jgi:hypothetical protein
VTNGKLTATTQYYPDCYVPEFARNKQQIRDKLHSYWQEVAPLIQATNYTIDIVLSPDLSRAWVVEINGPVWNASRPHRERERARSDICECICCSLHKQAVVCSIGKIGSTVILCRTDHISCAFSKHHYRCPSWAFSLHCASSSINYEVPMTPSTCRSSKASTMWQRPSHAMVVVKVQSPIHGITVAHVVTTTCVPIAMRSLQHKHAMRRSISLQSAPIQPYPQPQPQPQVELQVRH